LIEVRKVIRNDSKQAKKVTIGAGTTEIDYVLNGNGKLIEYARRSLDKQVLDDQSLIISPADYSQAVRTATAILREKRRKVPTR